MRKYEFNILSGSYSLVILPIVVLLFVSYALGILLTGKLAPWWLCLVTAILSWFLFVLLPMVLSSKRIWNKVSNKLDTMTRLFHGKNKL